MLYESFSSHLNVLSPLLRYPSKAVSGVRLCPNVLMERRNAKANVALLKYFFMSCGVLFLFRFNWFHFFYPCENLAHVYFSRHLAEAGARDIVVTFETVEIHFGKDITKCVIRESEQKCVFGIHLSFQVVSDVWKGLSRDCQYFRSADLEVIDSCLHGIAVDRCHLQRRMLQNITHNLRVDGKLNCLRLTENGRVVLRLCVTDNTQGLIRQQGTYTYTFLPGVRFLAILEPHVGCDHSALGAVHKHRDTANARLNPIVHRAAKVGTKYSSSRSQYFRMNGIVHQRCDHFVFVTSRGCDSLNDATARIV